MQAGQRYYFEIRILAGNLFKIGVCRKNAPYEKAFSDSLEGWALFNGEMRHGSNVDGEKLKGLPDKSYSKTEPGDVIGVLVDMIEGKISYSKNGTFLGLAFEDAEIATGELYPAVATIKEQDEFEVSYP